MSSSVPSLFPSFAAYFPNSALLILLNLASSASLELEVPPLTVFAPLLEVPEIEEPNFFNPSYARAVPANVPKSLVELALFSPNIFFINFSAGIKNPIATRAYNGFFATKSLAAPINDIYNNK